MLNFVISIVARYWAFACAATVLYMLRERVGAFFVNCLLLTLRIGELIFTTVFFCLRPKLRYIPKGQVKKVAVIGAGASGITAAKEAIEAGMETVVFEQTDKLGGNWLFREEENFGSVYRSTFINTSKQMMMYSDFPMPSHYPTYPHHSQIIEYFTAYCEKFGVMKKIRFNTKVVDVSLNEDGHSWTVVSIRTPSDFIGKPHERFLAEGKKVTEQYDAIVVANGHHSVPRWPDPKFPGQDTFQGHMIHSHAYRDPTSCNKGYDFNHKKTVVVGIGNSAVDIATELSRHGQVYLSQRSGTWVMPKWISGYAFDHLLSPPRWFFEIVPKFMHYTQALAKKQGVDVGGKIEEVQGSMASWGLNPRGKWETMHPTISHDLLHRISTGTVKVCKNIVKIEPKHVTFEDGVRVEADAIIFCTGYNVSFPFLKPSLQPLGKSRGERKIVPKETENKGDDHPENNGIEVYKFIFSPKLPVTMAHIGLFQPLGAIMPMSEMQSRWLMQIWTGKKGVATPEGMQKDIDKYREYVTTRYLDRPRHTIQTDGPVFMDELSGFVGCRPNLLNPKNWGCLKELLFAPVAWPVVFRLNGPGAWPGAADALKQAYGQIWARPENETAPELTHHGGKESKTNGHE